VKYLLDILLDFITLHEIYCLLGSGPGNFNYTSSSYFSKSSTVECSNKRLGKSSASVVWEGEN